MEKKKGKEKKRKEIHTCVARGRYVALGIWGFTTWVSFIRSRRGYIEEEKMRLKRNLLHIYIYIYS